MAATANCLAWSTVISVSMEQNLFEVRLKKGNPSFNSAVEPMGFAGEDVQIDVPS
jgi:hypothetical protein